MPVELQTRMANGGTVNSPTEGAYALKLPPLPRRTYGLAQIDDYVQLPRSKFPHQPPLSLTLEARVSEPHLPGTWGFGLWNDPFSFSFGGGGMARTLPVLPNAAWFFYGSPEFHLTLHDDLPGAGFQAMAYQYTRLPQLTSLLTIPVLPLLAWSPLARFFRKLARRVIKQAATTISLTDEDWHIYNLQWLSNRVNFTVDNDLVMETTIVPQGPLGLVIWIDNQFFRFNPEGRIGFGFLKTDLAGSLHIRNLLLDE